MEQEYPIYEDLTWTEVECPNSGPREEHTCTLFQNYIITFGGADQNHRLNDIVVFNIKTSTWEKIKPDGQTLSARGGHTACLYKENQIIVYGGHTADYNVMDETGILTITNVEPFALEWKVQDTQGKMARIWHTSHIYEDKMYVCGGGDDTYFSTNDVYYLDLGTFVWTKCQVAGDVPSEYRSHGSALYEGKIYIFGGFSSQRRNMFDTLHILDIATMNMTRAKKTLLWPTGSTGCSISEKSGELYIFGGKLPTNTFGNDLLVYNIKEGTWRHEKPKGVSPPPRGYHRCVTLDDSIIFWGGGIDSIQFSNIYRLYLGRSSWVTEQPKPILRPKNSKYREHIKALLFNEEYADIYFIMGDTKISANKGILAARCKYFENMFSSNMQETFAKEIQVPDMKPETFKALIEFIYCDELDISESLAIDLLELASKYVYLELIEATAEFLSDCLTPENFVEIANASESLDIPLLKRRVLEFADKNYDQLEKEGIFYELPKSLLVELLSKAKHK